MVASLIDLAAKAALQWFVDNRTTRGVYVEDVLPWIPTVERSQLIDKMIACIQSIDQLHIFRCSADFNGFKRVFYLTIHRHGETSPVWDYCQFGPSQWMEVAETVALTESFTYVISELNFCPLLLYRLYMRSWVLAGNKALFYALPDNNESSSRLYSSIKSLVIEYYDIGLKFCERCFVRYRDSARNREQRWRIRLTVKPTRMRYPNRNDGSFCARVRNFMYHLDNYRIQAVKEKFECESCRSPLYSFNVNAKLEDIERAMNAINEHIPWRGVIKRNKYIIRYNERSSLNCV